MAVFNLKRREIECKIVYYGPGRCGKTTNLEFIFRSYKKQIVGEMVSINTEGDRTLFFDFLPMGLGKIRGCDVRVQLYTVPGQVQYSSTRKLVLRGVDGISAFLKYLWSCSTTSGIWPIRPYLLCPLMKWNKI